VVSPSSPIRRGDRVIVKTRDGQVTAQELRRRTPKTIEIKSLNAQPGERVLPVSDVVWMARIVWASQ